MFDCKQAALSFVNCQFQPLIWIRNCGSKDFIFALVAKQDQVLGPDEHSDGLWLFGENGNPLLQLSREQVFTLEVFYFVFLGGNSEFWIFPHFTSS